MGAKLDDAQIERVKQVFLDCGKVRETARRLSLPESTIRPYCKQNDEFAQVRAEKRVALIGDVAEEMASVRQLYLDHLRKPATIATATAKDAAIIVGVLTDKHQLVTGEATQRTEHTDGNDARSELLRRVDDLAARRAARGDSEPHGDTG